MMKLLLMYCKSTRVFVAGLGIFVFTTTQVMAGNIWISPQELSSLPTSGSAWDEIRNIANNNIGSAVGGHNDNHDTETLAQALVAARLNDNSLKAKVADNLMSAIGSDANGNSLSISRNLASYVIAADVIDFKNYDPSRELKFRNWVANMLTKEHDGGGCGSSGCSIIGKHEDRPNNHGTMAGASRVAASLYLNNVSDVARAARVFEGYLGNRNAYAGFKYGETSWQADAGKPVGINPKGASKSGHSIDGVLPDDMRRGGSFQWPPLPTGYVWEGLQGAVTQAEILHRAGYDSWNWGDKALLRAVKYLYSIGWEPEGDDMYIIQIINYRYGTNYSVGAKVGHGKNMGWTGWTHGERDGSGGGSVDLIAPAKPTITSVE